MTLYIKDTLPASSEEAIRKFETRYNAILVAGNTGDWVNPFIMNVDSPRTTYPLSAFTSGFRETKEGSGRFRGMSDKTFDLNVSEFDDGYEAKLADILTNVFAWQRWNEVPQAFVTAERRHHASKLAKLLEAGQSTACKYDDVNFFATTHLSNPMIATSAQFSNYDSAGLAPETLTNVSAQMTQMRLVKDVNGEKLGVEPTEIWLPTEKFQVTSDALNKDFLANGESNTMKGKLKPVHVPQLTDPNDWYLVDGNLLTAYTPMLSVRWTTLEGKLGLRTFDETSDHTKKTGKIAISKHIWTGQGLLFPHAIRKVAGA